jgi:hypothetical protein
MFNEERFPIFIILIITIIFIFVMWISSHNKITKLPFCEKQIDNSLKDYQYNFEMDKCMKAYRYK